MTSLVRLSLDYYRNYNHLVLDFPSRLTLLCGNNAQGKTNLLEAIFLLATSKPVHATVEREVVGWEASDEPIPYCRVAAIVQNDHAGQSRNVELEIIYTPRADGINFTKQVKINGVGKRSMDLVGRMRSVLFLPEDIKLVDGSPSERRRYLDVALCQIDPVYCRTLSSFQKVVTQRNSLLKSLRNQDTEATSDSVEAQLIFWDEQLVGYGVDVLVKRIDYTSMLSVMARRRHAELTEGRESLLMEYLPSFNVSTMDEAEFQRWKEGDAASETDAILVRCGRDVIMQRYHAKLQSRRAREISAGATLYGPHRDDLRFLADGRDLRTFGSRGQQRTAALSLKLAEVQAMTETTGDAPLLLLDDVMSELDARRRGMLLQTLDSVEQAIITTTDWNDFGLDFRNAAACLVVQNGTISLAPEMSS